MQVLCVLQATLLNNYIAITLPISICILNNKVLDLAIVHKLVVDDFCQCCFVHTIQVTSFCVSYGGQGIPRLHFTSVW